MPRALIAGLVTTLLLYAPLDAQAWKGKEDKGVSYGTYCSTRYGAKDKSVTLQKAMEQLRKFYARRGFEVQMESHKGWVIRAGIFKGNKKIDSIVYDIRTGRMRSIY